jgi:autotransporter-associated beta strand protein
MSGKYVFERNGATGKIINEGNITAALAGYVALLAPEVQNAGVVVARAGTVAMAAGETITLNIDGAGSLAGITTTPSAIATLIENKQAVQAPDGQIILSAVALNKLQAGVIKNSGSLEANSLVSKGGKIYLEGDDITLTSTSKIEAKGATGGGTVLVGGDWQGSGDFRQATKVTMAAGATIEASATDKGDGGKVVLWSDIHHAGSQTIAHGSIKAEAGPNGGDGGKVETSGHYLNVDDIQVSTQSSKGQAGEWLLDPYNITIASSAAGDTWATGSVTSGTDVSYTPTTQTSTILASTITGALATGNVTLSTGAVGSAGADVGNISISSALSWATDKTLTLSAANGISGSSGISMTGGGGLVVNQAGTSTYAGSISGSGTFTKNGTGALTLTGNQTYSGTTTIAAGTLNISQSGLFTFGAGNIVIDNPTGLLKLSAANLSVVANNISGSGSLMHSGASFRSITLTGNNTYTGTTTVNAGTLQIGNGGTAGTLGTGAVSLPTSSSSLNFNRTDALTVANTISGPGTITQSGTGSTVLTGNNTNTGATNITAGTLQIGDGGTTGSLGSGNVTLPASGPATATLSFNRSDNITFANNITGGSGGIAQIGGGTTLLTGTNTYGTTTISAGTLQIGNGGASSSARLGQGTSTSSLGSGAITGSGTGVLSINFNNAVTIMNTMTGSVGLTKDGAGTLTLSPSVSNTYSGVTTIANGTLKAGSSNALGLNSPIYFSNNSGATLDVSGNPQTLGTLYGGGSTGGNIILGAVALSIGGDGGSGVYAGLISGTGGITKLGAGTQTLSGASSYSGATNVNGGTLKLGSAGSGGNTPLGTSAGNTAISATGTLDLNGYLPGDGLSLTGTLINSSSTAVTFKNTDRLTIVGTPTVKADFGAINLNAMAGTATVTLDGNTAGSINGDIGFSASLKPSIVKKGTGTWVLNGVNNYFSSGNYLDIQAGRLQLGTNVQSVQTLMSPTISIASGATFDVASNYDIGFVSTLLGSGALTKSGGATSTLRFDLGSPTFTGPVTVSAGTLVAGSASQTGSSKYLGTGSITVLDGGALDAMGKTIANSITLNGMGVNGGGALVSNSTIGAATLSGPLTLGSDASIVGNTTYGINLTNPGTITNNNYSLTLGGSTGGTLSDVFTGSGSITKVGLGTWTLSGNNTYTGETYVNTGTLAVTTSSALGSTSGGTTVTTGATLALNFPIGANSATATISENVTLSGPGVYNTATSSYAGALTTGSAPTVNYTGTLTLDNTTLIVANSGKVLNVTNPVQGESYDLAKKNTVNLAQNLTPDSTGTVTANYAFVRPTTSSSVYGDAPSISYALYTTGMGNVLSAASATGAPVFTGIPTGTSDAGSYQLTYASGLTANNYALFSGTPTAWTVSPKTITLAAVPLSKNYGGVDPQLTARVTNGSLISTDSISDVTGVLTRGAGESVGNYNIALGTGTKTSNYTITYAANNQAFTINQAPLTITANNASKTYDGQSYLGTYGVSYSPFANGETSSVLGGVLSFAGNSQNAVNAGSYAISPTGLTSGNYAITFLDGTLTINKAHLTVTASNASKTYGDTNPALTTTISGFVNGENLVTSGVSGSGTATSNATASTSVGTTRITAGAGNLTAANYDFTDLVNGSLTINPRPVSLLGQMNFSGDITLNTTNTGTTLAASNLVQGDSLNISGTALLAAATAGTQPITDFNGLNLGNSNYTTSGASGSVTVIPTNAINVTPLNNSDISKLIRNQLADLSNTQLGSLSASQLQVFSAQQLASLTASQMSGFSGTQIRNLSNTQLSELTPAQISQLTSNTSTQLSYSQLATFTPLQIAAISPTQIAGMTAAELGSLSDAQLQALTPAQLAVIKPANFGALSAEQIMAMSADQVVSLSPEQLASFTPLQIAGLNSVEINRFNSLQLAAIGITSQTTASTAPAKQDVTRMTGLEVRTLTSEQLNALPYNQIASLKPLQLQALTTEQLSQLSRTQIEYLSPEQLAVMSQHQLQVLLPGPRASEASIVPDISESNKQSLTGVLAITILQSATTKPVSAGVAFEQDVDTISFKKADAPSAAPMTDNLVFSDKLMTFMVATSDGEMVEFQGTLVNNRMVIVAPSPTAKRIARSEMNLVLAAAVTSLGKDNRVMLANLSGVLLDLR